MIWRSPQQRDRAMSVRRLATVLAVCCALPFSSLFATQSAQAQDANGGADALPELRRGLDGDVPLVDENLDGIDDRQQPDVVRPRQSVTFDTPIDNSANDGADPDRTNDASRNRRARDAAGSSNTTTNGGGRQGQAGRLGRDPALNRGQLTGSTQTQQQAREDGNSRARRAQPVGAPGVDGEITPLANQRVAPIERTRTPAEADPYAAIGIRTGTFDWFPTLTQTFGYTSNADASAGGQGSAFSQTDAAVSVRSNWALHELRGEASLGYQTFFSDANNRVPSLNLSGAYRHDLAQDLLIRIAASYGLTTESPSSDNLLLPVGVTLTNRPFVHSGGISAELERVGTRLTGRLRGAINRQSFGDVDAGALGTISQTDRNNTLYELSARLGFEISPAVQPFLEASLGARRFDVAVDRNGNRRSSLLAGLRGGFAVNFGEKWSGQASVGYQLEDFDDPALTTLGGITVDGSLVWSPRRLTTITATASTAFTPATAANENGSITYTGQLQWSYDVRPELSLTASVLGSLRNFDSTGVDEVTLQTQAGFEYRFNRSLAFIGNIGFETVDSSTAGSDYDAFTARAGLRWQR